MLDEIVYLIQENETFDRNLRALAAMAKHQITDTPASSSSSTASASAAAAAAAAKLEMSRKALGLSPAANAVTGSNSASSTASSGAATANASSLDLVHVTKLNESVQELISHYCSLEEWFLFQNVQKAIVLDERESEQSLVSTVVDDIFYVFKKCARRAFHTGSGIAICTMINHLNGVLVKHVREVLEAMCAETIAASKHMISFATPKGAALPGGVGGSGSDSKSGAAGTVSPASTKSGAGGKAGDGSAAGGGGGGGSGVAIDMFTIANNMALAASHMVTLQRFLLKQFESAFTQHESKRMIKHAVDEMVEVSSKLAGVARGGVTAILNVMRPTFQPLVDEFTKSNYELPPPDYGAGGGGAGGGGGAPESTEQYIPRLVDGINSEFVVLKHKFSDSNYTYFVTSVAAFVVGRIEL